MTKLTELIEAGQIVTVNGNPKFRGNYFFTPEELQVIIDEACYNQRKICATKYHNLSMRVATSSIDIIDGINNVPQPKTGI